jgi:hypothetical protein
MKGILGLALVAGLATFAAAPAFSDSDNAAIVAKDGLCGLQDGDGNFVLTSSSIQVTNNGGVTTLVCKVKDVPNSTGSAVHYDFESTGFLCNTNGGQTEDWSETVSASGNATLVCRINN